MFLHLKQDRNKYANDKKQVVKAENGFKKISANRIKKTIIANGDDEYVDYFLDFWAEEKMVYTNESELKANLANNKMCIVKYGDVKSDKVGVSFKLDKTEIKLNLLGEYNAAIFWRTFSASSCCRRSSAWRSASTFCR